MDKAYDIPTGEKAAAKRQFIGHIRRIGEEPFDETRERRYPARRRAVERKRA